MKVIGGYFELELPKGKEYHQDAIRLNTGRNAFEYILRTKGYQKVYLPYYTCDAMLEPINKLALNYEFYQIDETFRPIFDASNIKHKVAEAQVYSYFPILIDKEQYVITQDKIYEKLKSKNIFGRRYFYLL